MGVLERPEQTASLQRFEDRRQITLLELLLQLLDGRRHGMMVEAVEDVVQLPGLPRWDVLGCSVVENRKTT